MERKPKLATEATSILSASQRAMAVWLLSRLSLLLVIALVALPGLFALDLMAGPPRPEQARLPVSSQESFSPSRENRGTGVRLAGDRRSGASATPTALPDTSTAIGLNRSRAIVSATRPQATVLSQPESQQVQSTVAPPVAVTVSVSPSATAASSVTAATLLRPALIQATMVPTQASILDPGTSPVQIRIPAIKVKRSIIELPQIQDPKTGSWTQDLEVLFRKGRKDLVGHYEYSAQPGQAGNTILVGHNYGYGTKGVFLKLGRLQQGQKIEVVNAAGQTFTYQVTLVEKVPWRSKDANELVQHARLLALSGGERLTLVTCGGSNIQPFPARIYVVAEPVRD